MSTIRDVARAAGVSTASVSFTLNGTKKVSEDLRQRVLQAVEEVGYEPNSLAQGLKKGRTNLLGLIVPDITNPYFAVLARAAETAATARGYTVLLCNTDEDARIETTYLNLMRSQRVAGIVISPTGSAQDYGQSLAAKITVPVVMVDRITRGVEWDSVISRNEEGARRAVMHLIERGHRRIGGLFGREHVSSIQQRIAGFSAALVSAGIDPDPDYIRIGCRDQAQAQIAAQSLLNLPDRPTALFTSNNQVMIGTMHAIRNHGLTCPDDISITGFDGLGWAEVMKPPMTTVEQPGALIGEEAVNLLVQRIEGNKDEPRHIELPTQLMVRESSTPPALR